ncbi:MAG: hypothetical protein PHW92_10560 [Lutibacter sp.]|nr:hypothetical protein [Lutibacter sp.]
MKEFQSTPNCFSGVLVVVFGKFNNLLDNIGFHKYKTGFLAGFPFYIIPLILQMNKLNIPYNFKYNKTLHI